MSDLIPEPNVMYASEIGVNAPADDAIDDFDAAMKSLWTRWEIKYLSAYNEFTLARLKYEQGVKDSWNTWHEEHSKILHSYKGKP
jgi:hypothetical protein